MLHVVDVVALGLVEVMEDPSAWPDVITGLHGGSPTAATELLAVARGRIAHLTAEKVESVLAILPARDICALTEPTWFPPDVHHVLRLATTICACKHIDDLFPDAADYEFHTTIAGLVKQLQKARLSLRDNLTIQ
jgi:hypothetical protein